MPDAPRLVLASGSVARRRMMEQADVPFSVELARIDEAALKAALIQHTTCMPFEDLAVALAEHKALDVSRRQPSALVIGSDQVLGLREQALSKAANRDEALRALLSLRGQTHQLHSGVALAQDGAIVWRHVETAKLTMRDFSDDWLEHYLDRAGDALTHSVGAYYLEGLGAQLFGTIEGDYFTILGMPLLPLLGELRRREVLAS